MTMAALPTAQLIIYCILALPVLYCLYSHGKPGLLGWLYLFVFCTLRIIGSGLELRQGDLDSSSSSALLVNNIGLSPLLLAAMGILHEARAARNLISNAKLEWAFVLIYHVAVSASLAIIACAISALTNKDSKMSATTSLDLVKVGFVIMLVCWLALVAWTSISSRTPRDCDLISRRYVDGIKLTYAVVISWPLIMLRGIYGLISVTKPSSRFSDSLAANVCLSVVPQLLLAVIFVLVGIWTRHIDEKQDERLKEPQRYARDDEMVTVWQPESGDAGIMAK
ncbi:hypothetical protein C8Q69DRAFT_106389 [Paecilomyces variotii]|uniref:DUF7702 domain-containing protein n=1 Tax=Byssochlamys spectabilis TaxID=264951 RepID=A0A443HK87_BYSSP|nr:hypothetical protein C8Q69DRAFT_106389 [Paecilomyces variotii]RWQ92194.1 hypothetical protein C8Q69DRAFT_106389 [Paecilomyces variotii]